MTRRFLGIAIRLFLAPGVWSAACQAQQALPPAPPVWQTAAGSKMDFEVATVRPSKPGTPFGASVSLDALDGVAPTGSLFTANAPLMGYLIFAFKISDSIQGRGIYDELPMWAKSQFFSIEARAEGIPTRDQLRLMVQSLLADRFKLAIHREMQQHDEFALVLDKPGTLGPQLQRHPPDKLCASNPSAALMIAMPAKDTEAPHYCGLVTWRIDNQLHLRMTDVTMGQIANYLSGTSMAAGTVTPHSGVDRTEQAGRFDLDLQFAPEIDGPGSDPDASGPTFSGALKKQLGMKLVQEKGQVEVLVIDHIEMPTEN